MAKITKQEALPLLKSYEEKLRAHVRVEQNETVRGKVELTANILATQHNIVGMTNDAGLINKAYDAIGSAATALAHVVKRHEVILPSNVKDVPMELAVAFCSDT